MRITKSQGFTLVEMMVALVIASLMVGIGAPAAYKYYETAKYREAIRTVQSAANAARLKAVSSGHSWDLLIDADEAGVLAAHGSDDVDSNGFIRLGDGIQLSALTAKEYARADYAAIRFFPSGSSSGGNIRVAMEGRATAVINVDWLLGRVTQELDARDD